MNRHQQPIKNWAMSQHDIYFNYNVVLPRHVFEEIVDSLLTSHSEAIRERVEVLRKPKEDWVEESYTAGDTKCIRGGWKSNKEYNQALDDILALLNDSDV